MLITLNKNDITIFILGKSNPSPLPITQIRVSNYPYLVITHIAPSLRACEAIQKS